ncbi:hypothetical protein CLOM_g13566 [Closterium sp. NIES-68]|nr:hypothetical protein CLOM_g13566 [Closterium sp. NIES-68]
MASLHLHSVAPVAVTRHRATAPSHFKALPSPHSLVPALSSRDTFCHSPLTVPLRPALTVRPARRSPVSPFRLRHACAVPRGPDHLVQFAHRLADAAREVVPPFFRRPISIELKADESPVTAADRAAEEAITALIRAEYPAHGILGEEQGLQGPWGRRGRGRRGRCASGCGWWTPSTARRVSSRASRSSARSSRCCTAAAPCWACWSSPCCGSAGWASTAAPPPSTASPSPRAAAPRCATPTCTPRRPTSSPAPAARRSAR